MFNFRKILKESNHIHNSGIPQKKESLQSLWRLLQILMANLDFDDVVYKVVNSLLTELGYLNSGYRIVVLSLVDKTSGGLRRIALSQTPEAARAVAVSTIPFEKIVIPFSATSNLCIKVLSEKKPMVTNYWPDILTPPLTPEAALTNQEAAGIKTSMVYPVFEGGKPLGCLILSMVKDYRYVTEEEKDLLSGFSDLVGLAVQNSLLFTSLRRTTQELQEANKKLQDLDKLKDEFVSVTSHELRAPMTVIKSYLWMALNKHRQEMPTELLRYLNRSYLSTERLINLVNDMLNVSRIEGGRVALNLSTVDIVELAQEVTEDISHKAHDKGIEFKLDKVKIGYVFCDRDKIREVLLNLVDNAVKFTPSGGSVVISFEVKFPFVIIQVKDSGRGISKEDVGRLFSKFGRLDNSYVAMAESGGTGLGLYIAKSLVELHRGEIKAESEGIGKGTRFSFSLPIAGSEIAKKLEAIYETNVQTKHLTTARVVV